MELTTISTLSERFGISTRTLRYWEQMGLIASERLPDYAYRVYRPETVERIAQMIFGDIYTTKKYRYGKYDFAFDSMVDGVTVGAVTGGMNIPGMF